MRSILEAEAMIEPLIEIGLQLAEMAVDTFAGLPPEHPVFERYSAIQPTDIDRYKEIVDSVKARGTATGLSASARTKLLAVGLAYIEPRHRLGPDRRPVPLTGDAGARRASGDICRCNMPTTSSSTIPTAT